MPTLEPGTLPSTGGTAELTGATAVGPEVSVLIASNVAQDGIFTYSNIRVLISPVITSTSDVLVKTASSLSQSGIFVNANIRPVLTGITSISLVQPGTGPQTAAPAQTRQLLIR